MNFRALIRLVAFLAVAGTFAVMELTTLTGPHAGASDTYHAIFTGPDGVSGLRAGNPVRVSGVAVGKVDDVALVDATHAKVTFTANHNQKITSHTWALVRYANLLGQRYLALTQAGSTPGDLLAPGATIPQQRTAPALSLTQLFNGFRPLFSALTPEQVNELSQDIIDVLQGQSNRIEDLIGHTASLTSNLADRDQTFTKVIDSLATLLQTVAKRDNDLAKAVVSLHGLTERLHEDGAGITGSLGAVDGLIGSVGTLFGQLEDHSLPQDLKDASSITGVLAKNTGTVDSLITGFAAAFKTFSRITQFGNWINFYPCNVSVKTYGSVTVTAKQVVGSLSDLLNGGSGNILGGLVNGLLNGLPLGGLGLPVPIQLPNGRVGGSTDHTAVCK